MFSGIAIGQYLPGNSPPHRLDPRGGVTMIMVSHSMADVAGCAGASS